ncbi:hypothetical protein BCR37DRAFT_380900 [Protomyces lactucae-debilis]|uniref:Uncharacterized protein n=1 Tax=Protomyces lactucae-debilis TaxID=2754530 RepID=A0A1Y2FAQ9_PROLT|nr:uncharacterized protein BCR37DRAFT_380900 [Protomyces lactucae-debilis]ORY81012.1 hypothetical protein BCR37DRAFT_380900 [Protomyces lactucae-debilis]
MGSPMTAFHPPPSPKGPPMAASHPPTSLTQQLRQMQQELEARMERLSSDHPPPSPKGPPMTASHPPTSLTQQLRQMQQELEARMERLRNNNPVFSKPITLLADTKASKDNMLKVDSKLNLQMEDKASKQEVLDMEAKVDEMGKTVITEMQLELHKWAEFTKESHAALCQRLEQLISPSPVKKEAADSTSKDDILESEAKLDPQLEDMASKREVLEVEAKVNELGETLASKVKEEAADSVLQEAHPVGVKKKEEDRSSRTGPFGATDKQAPPSAQVLFIFPKLVSLDQKRPGAITSMVMMNLDNWGHAPTMMAIDASSTLSEANQAIPKPVITANRLPSGNDQGSPWCRFCRTYHWRNGTPCQVEVANVLIAPPDAQSDGEG